MNRGDGNSGRECEGSSDCGSAQDEASVIGSRGVYGKDRGLRKEEGVLSEMHCETRRVCKEGKRWIPEVTFCGRC